MSEGNNFQVIMGVCQTDFFNHKIFESVFDKKHEGLTLFRDGKYEYIGVAVPLDEKGKATLEAIEVAYQAFQSLSFGSMSKVTPKLYQLGGK